MTNQLSRKSQDVEGFQFTWAIILFETQAGIKMPRLPILEKKRIFSKTTSISPNKPNIHSIVLRIPMQYEILTRNLDVKRQIVLLKSFKDFSAENVIVFQKISSFELLEIAWAIRIFGKHSEGKYPCLVFLKTFKCSLEKRLFLFPKNLKFWMSSKHMSNGNVRDVFEKKLVKLNVFESFKTSFSSDLFIFPKKAKFWKFWEFSGSEYFGTFSRWN